MENKLQKNCGTCRYFVFGFLMPDKKPTCVRRDRPEGSITEDYVCSHHSGIATREEAVEHFKTIYRLLDDLADYIGVPVVIPDWR